jgi:hypothetical protein
MRLFTYPMVKQPLGYRKIEPCKKAMKTRLSHPKRQPSWLFIDKQEKQNFRLIPIPNLHD